MPTKKTLPYYEITRAEQGYNYCEIILGGYDSYQQAPIGNVVCQDKQFKLSIFV